MSRNCHLCIKLSLKITHTVPLRQLIESNLQSPKKFKARKNQNSNSKDPPSKTKNIETLIFYQVVNQK